MTKLVSIVIDGRHLEVEESANLLRAAREHGVDIPGLCFHPRLTPTGACRLCVVKVAAIPGLQMACTLRAVEGLEVIAFDEEIEAARKKVVDYLLAEHDDSYDRTYRDELRDAAIRYGLLERAHRKAPNIQEELALGLDDSSPVLTYDGAKCIKCFRCIKACDEVQGKNVLSFAERGIESCVVAGLDCWSDSECDGCGECVQLCPTGALVEKPHRDVIDLERIEKRVRTTCPYCGVGCQIELLIQDGRIVRANGVEGILPNDGRLCVKGRFGYDFVSSEDRLRVPLVRRNGELRPVSWEEALELVASRFSEIRDQHGPAALAGYASAKCTNEDNYVFQKFVRVAFGNNNIDYCTRLCHASTVTAMLRSLGNGAGSNSIEDFAAADCLLVIGNNLIETHPVTGTYAKQGIARGAKLIVCDPKWTPMALRADIWLQPRLGTDLALLNGMIHQVFADREVDETFVAERVRGGMEALNELEEATSEYTPEAVERITGVPADKVVAAARLYARASRPIIATGMGLSQQINGTNTVFALINLMLVAGQVGREGAGIYPPRGQNNVQGTTDVGCSPTLLPGYLPVSEPKNRRRIEEIWSLGPGEIDPQPGLSTVEMMHAAHAGQIKGMFIVGENPMVTDPHSSHTREALENIDFLVVQDIFPTETTALADVILPAASFAEKDGTFVNSDRRVIRVRKALESPGEAREDWKIVLDVAARMGYDLGGFDTAEQIFEEIRLAAPILAGIGYERIEVEGIQWPCPSPDHPGTATLFLDRFDTPDGKAILFPVDYEADRERYTAEYPFLLNTGRILYQYHSCTMSRRCDPLNAFANEPYVLMNPADAARLGFAGGSIVRVSSPRGELETVLRESVEVAVGELFMPWHYPEVLVNSLTRAELDPASRIPPYKLTACRVEGVRARDRQETAPPPGGAALWSR